MLPYPAGGAYLGAFERENHPSLSAASEWPTGVEYSAPTPQGSPRYQKVNFQVYPAMLYRGF